MYLLDTDIVLDLRRAKTEAAASGLRAWAGGMSRTSLFISAVALLELQTTVEQALRRDKAAGGVLRTWLDTQVFPAFEGRILAVDAAVVRRSGQLLPLSGRDALIAATALEHGLTLVTGQGADFKAARVKLFDPRSYKPQVAVDDDDWGQAARAGSQWLRNIFVRG
jgi:predicted nucleic acid-binding protein